MKKLYALGLWLLLAAPTFAGFGGTAAYTPPWVDKQESGGIVYLLYQAPFALKRFELASGSWLPTIEFALPPRAFAALPDGFVIAFSNKVSRFDFNGNNEQVLANAWSNPTDIAADDGFLFVFKNGEIQSVRLADGVQVDRYTSFGNYNSPELVTLATGANAFFGWDIRASPSDIVRLGYNPSTGMFAAVPLDSPYHGDFPRGGRLFTNASGQRVLDRAGIAYRGPDLAYFSGLGGYVRDVAFGASHTLLARDDSAVLLDANLREVGVAVGEGAVHGVAFAGTDAVLFGGSDGLAVSTIRLSSFTDPPAAAATSPTSVYALTTLALSDAGHLFLFDRDGSTVHRFDLTTWDYLPSVALSPQTDFVSLDQVNGRLYVAEKLGRLSVVPSGHVHASFLAYSPPDLTALGAMDSYLMVADLTGANQSFRVFNGTSGVETDWVDWNYSPQDFTWDRASRRMRYFRDTVTSLHEMYYQEISSTGEITGAEQVNLGSTNAFNPIRFAPSGNYVVLGSGQILRGFSLALLGSLGETMIDAAWSGTTLYTLRSSALPGRSEITRWSPSLTPVTRRTIPGIPVALFARDGQLVSVTRQDGNVRIFRYPANLDGLNVSAALDVSRASAYPGEALAWTGRVTNEGVRAAQVSSTLSFDHLPPGLSVLCELDGAPIGCAAGLPIVATINSGSTLTLRAAGTMHQQQVPIIAQLTASVADDRPEDNASTATVVFNARIFLGGFEGAQ